MLREAAGLKQTGVFVVHVLATNWRGGHANHIEFNVFDYGTFLA